MTVPMCVTFDLRLLRFVTQGVTSVVHFSVLLFSLEKQLLLLLLLFLMCYNSFKVHLSTSPSVTSHNSPIKHITPAS